MPGGTDALFNERLDEARDSVLFVVGHIPVLNIHDINKAKLT